VAPTGDAAFFFAIGLSLDREPVGDRGGKPGLKTQNGPALELSLSAPGRPVPHKKLDLISTSSGRYCHTQNRKSVKPLRVTNCANLTLQPLPANLFYANHWIFDSSFKKIADLSEKCEVQRVFRREKGVVPGKFFSTAEHFASI
jgi:hypothetical protein